MAEHNTARLLICCPDQKGIVAAVTNFIFQNNGNIIRSDQHSTDFEHGRFFMRLEFDLASFKLSREVFNQAFAELAERFKMDWQINYSADKKRLGLFVSHQTHCLMELLWRWKAEELPVEIPFIISNHEDAGAIAADFHIPFHHYHIEQKNKLEQEANILKQIEGKTDLLVLARYMQILSGSFIEQYPYPIINIHHSFLPAFAGAKPYQQAFERGVKIIGATAHYATQELDEGPIIEQDVIKITH
ncbi:MAG: formyltetrahydrofolate deformylase, partial [Candidatus Margulisiibacteriota bacterium]